MAKPQNKGSHEKHMSLLLVEGRTEVVFYKRIQDTLLRSCRSTIRDLEGLYNIDKKIISHIVDYAGIHEDEKIRVYCCLDRESRYGEVPEFNLEKIRKYIEDKQIENVLSIDLIKATQQIESWFLYDIEGIYTFLKVPTATRKPNAYKPPERFGSKDLQHLFERYNKIYSKGKRCENFINHLDIEKIVRECRELREGIKLIKSQAGQR